MMEKEIVWPDVPLIRCENCGELVEPHHFCNPGVAPPQESE